uniref:Radical SAM enzyme, TIGR01210 family n=1 Tax=Candidatus Kentrum sp. TUN TaxID=2126343 RepID=A0A451A2X5_9GAMM|nr:MAG: radical SAM enzyme, TIGR01210 family [Candidatus Kentron sp. TUN]
MSKSPLISAARITEIRHQMNLWHKEWEKDFSSFFRETSPIADHHRPRLESLFGRPANSVSKQEQEINASEPVWATFATANPVIAGRERYPGIRACVAFHKVPCSFKMQTKGHGCLHCALSMANRNVTFIKSSEQIAAIKTAIKSITAKLGRMPPILEVLPDGSFLNPEEVPLATQENIFRIAAAENDIVQISIESRPEYISVERILHLLHILRDEQIMEIYIGLESIDPFILNHIIKKGFTVERFEEKMDEIAHQLPNNLKKRITISVYHFFNPPYLTEKESIESAIAMSRQMREYAHRTKIPFSVKYEPAVISKGTFQWYLFEHGKYTPPNYFSIAEIIPLAYFEGLSGHIKFGQRDDIDDFQSTASIPSLENPQMFSIFDFMVYNAVQRFNADQDIWMFCADMSVVLEDSPEFRVWEEAIYGKQGESALSRIFAEYKQKILGDNYKSRIAFQKKVGRILESIEYDNRDLSEKLREKGKQGASGIPAALHASFSRTGIKVHVSEKQNF